MEPNLSMEREPNDDFVVVQVDETFTASKARLLPSTSILEIPLSTDKGPASLQISNIREIPDDSEHYVALARVAVPARKGRFIVDHDVTISKDAPLVTVGDELNFEPKSEHKGIKSKKLWAGLGGAAVTVALGGIVITRKVMRARRNK